MVAIEPDATNIACFEMNFAAEIALGRQACQGWCVGQQRIPCATAFGRQFRRTHLCADLADAGKV